MAVCLAIVTWHTHTESQRRINVEPKPISQNQTLEVKLQPNQKNENESKLLNLSGNIRVNINEIDVCTCVSVCVCLCTGSRSKIFTTAREIYRNRFAWIHLWCEWQHQLLHPLLLHYSFVWVFFLARIVIIGFVLFSSRSFRFHAFSATFSSAQRPRYHFGLQGCDSKWVSSIEILINIHWIEKETTEFGTI